MPLVIRISSPDAPSRTYTLADGKSLGSIPVARGERVEVVDQDSPGVSLIPDGDDVALVWAGGNEAVSLAGLLGFLGEGGADITVVDQDAETVRVISSLEEILAGFSTAAGGAASSGPAASGSRNDGSIDEHGLEGAIENPLDLGPGINFGAAPELDGERFVSQEETGPLQIVGGGIEAEGPDNTRPKIGALTGHRTVTELGDGAPGEGETVLSTGGTIAFTEVDLGDTHTVTVLPQGSGYLGSLTAALADDSTGDGAGSVTWGFSVDDAAVDHLAAGETLVQRYVVRVSDGQGGVDNKLVAITIAGTNDAPAIGALTGNRTVTELADGDPDEGSAVLATGGQIAFGDVDLADTHAVTVLPQGAGYLGTLSAAIADDSTGDGTGSVAWSFSVDDAAVDHLEEGESLEQHYIVRIEDGHGGLASKLVEITIQGACDGPPVLLFSSPSADEALFGGEGDDVLTGGAGDDVLFGGQGDDVLEGGGGNDRFVIERGDLGDGMRPFTDTITDFGRGDTLDLTDVVDFFANDVESLPFESIVLADIEDGAAIRAQQGGQTIAVIENQTVDNLVLDQDGSITAIS
jgi:VCBS repeat-containing protein